MLTARTYGRQRLGVREGAACSFRSGDRWHRLPGEGEEDPGNRTCLPG